MDQPVAIISGAGRGIGRATAVELSGRRYQVVLVSRTESQLRQTRDLCRGKSDATLLIPADVSDADACERVVNQTLERFGRIDALVNSAGIAPMQDLESTTAQLWKEVIDTNLSSTFYLSRAVWGPMRQRGGGIIVNVSSFSARDPFPGLSAYAAAKGGVNLLTLALAREGAPHGIRVHCVAPAAVETEMFRKLVPVEQFPTEKALSPQDVAGIIAQCVAGDLRYTSGEVIWIQKSPR